jgi:23S rRNA (cytidine1920-2'-O)/16S rRNA (cytidine1409-2'-O)-methyltransferase
LARRERADRLLVAQGLAVDVDEAARLIRAGKVLAGTERIDKPGQLLAADSKLAVRGVRRFVSRGGEKLLAALTAFELETSGRVCLDAGSSTGGFTDCLLQHGAARVYAVDVGYGQLAWQLRSDERVMVLERTNVRTLDASRIEPRPTLIVADLSFISLRTVLLAGLLDAAAGGVQLLVMVKPQFELARDEVRGGVVTDPALRARAVKMVAQAGRDLGFAVEGPVTSPLPGPDGNVEFFLLMTRTSGREPDSPRDRKSKGATGR